MRSLQLGYYGSGTRPIFFLKRPEQLQGTNFREELIQDGVMALPNNQAAGRRRALNVLRTWDAYLISITVMLPMAFSLLTSVIWTIVAVLAYGADVQVSVQTAFTVGSYIVTTGEHSGRETSTKLLVANRKLL